MLSQTLFCTMANGNMVNKVTKVWPCFLFSFLFLRNIWLCYLPTPNAIYSSILLSDKDGY